jgi:hypothetical protein
VVWLVAFDKHESVISRDNWSRYQLFRSWIKSVSHDTRHSIGCSHSLVNWWSSEQEFPWFVMDQKSHPWAIHPNKGVRSDRAPRTSTGSPGRLTCRGWNKVLAFQVLHDLLMSRFQSTEKETAGRLTLAIPEGQKDKGEDIPAVLRPLQCWWLIVVH